MSLARRIERLERAPVAQATCPNPGCVVRVYEDRVDAGNEDFEVVEACDCGRDHRQITVQVYETRSASEQAQPGQVLRLTVPPDDGSD